MGEAMHHWVYKTELVEFDEKQPHLVGLHLTALAGSAWDLVTTCPLPGSLTPGSNFHFMATYRKACECHDPDSHTP